MSNAAPSARKAGGSYLEVVKPALILSALISLCYTAYLHMAGLDLEFQADALAGMYNVLPTAARDAVVNGGVVGTLVAIAAVIVRSVLLAIVGLVVGRWVLGQWMARKAAPTPVELVQQSLREKELLTVPLDDYEIVIITPKTKKYGPAQVHRNVFPEVYMRLDRAPLVLKTPPKDPIGNLQLAAHQILKKHADWSCDPAGHHADVGLYEHSIVVAKKMRELSTHRLAYTIGLLHDIGKLIAYTPSSDAPGGWDIRSTRHDKLTADVVRKLPEYQALPEPDQRVINEVLSYCHSRHELPEGTSEEVTDLIQRLAVADGFGIEQDKKRAVGKASNAEIINEVANALWQVIPALNINAFKEGNADGWTMEVADYVAVLESSIRRELANYLTPQRAHELQIRIDKAKIHDHPATRVIINALRQMGVLIEDHDGKPAFEGLYDAKVGSRVFVGVALLRKDQLEAVNQKMVNKWGDCNYSLKIREAKAARGDSTDADQTAEST